MEILVVDVGGNNVKIMPPGATEIRKFSSGRDLTPTRLVEGVKELVADVHYDVMTIGFPAPVVRGAIEIEPVNLGPGWVGFDFNTAFGKPLKIVNDAAMQAIGSYQGGRMLFLGLGTGLGSAFVFDGMVMPLELAHLPYRKGRTFEDYVGDRGMDRLGKRKWLRCVHDVVEKLRGALLADYVVLGGGNVRKLENVPPHVRIGSNMNAFEGGVRLWQAPLGEHQGTLQVDVAAAV